MPDQLTDAVHSLVNAARSAARTPAIDAQLLEIGDRLNGPLRLAIAGKVKAGKSTLLNAIVGEELAPTDAGECTKIVTWYLQADQPRVVLYPAEGTQEARPFNRQSGALDVDLGSHSSAEVDHLEVRWPLPQLRQLTLVDTPGIASISTEVSARTHRVLAPEDDRPQLVDAVLYLLRHTHASDVRFLESFHDDELAHGTTMNAVGVLSRADEIGACRLDAMETSERIAARYQGDPRLQKLCPIVIPVAGLLAFAGITLREAEFRSLAHLAAMPPDEIGEALLTADRAATREISAPVTEIERQHLLQRFGLFGVRLGVDLIGRRAAPDATALAAEFTARSGLDRLREVLTRQFTHRSQLLKARSALAAVNAIIDSGGCTSADSLRSRAEQIIAGAHAFKEIRLLNQLRSDEIDLDEERKSELERLLGARGHDARSRLGLPETAPADAVNDALLSSLARWQGIAEHPISSRPVQLAAQTAVRTLEGLAVAATA